MLAAMEKVTHCPLSSSGQEKVASLAASTLIAHIKQEGEGVCWVGMCMCVWVISLL